jgi:tol-pal system protein YbgF
LLLSSRIIWLLLLAAAPVWPQSREIIQLQRDMALLQDQVRTLQKSVEERFVATQQLLEQNLEAANRLTSGLAVLEKSMQNQERVVAGPLAGVSTRVETLATQFQALREAVEEVNSRLSRLQTQVADIKNLVSTVPPPGAAGAAAVPQVSAETLYNNALRDFQAGNYNLAGPQFSDYVKLYPHTDYAADAQYYLGEIFFQQGQFREALEAYDQVLERYPEGRLTPAAHFKKGQSLLKLGQREAAAREFRDITKKYPNTPAATQAAAELKRMGPGAGTRPAKSKQ